MTEKIVYIGRAESKHGRKSAFSKGEGFDERLIA